MECAELFCKGLSSDSFASGSSHPNVEVKADRVPAYRMSVLGNAAVKRELHAKFGDQLKKMTETAAYLDREVDEFVDPRGEYKELSVEYSGLVRDLVAFTREVIRRNKDGVGGEAKVLSYHPSGGYKIRYIPAAE